MIDHRADPAGDNAYAFTDGRDQPIARIAWLPQKPGAAILTSVVPFIAIALAGFALLAGLVMRYMRTTAATIVAGENRCAISRCCTTRCAACRTGISSANGWRR